MESYIKNLLIDVREKLVNDCRIGFGRKTWRFDDWSLTDEQKLERGDGEAWRIINEIDKLLDDKF